MTVSRLRRKLDGGLGRAPIVSAHGLGYVYRPPVKPLRTAETIKPSAGYGHAAYVLSILNAADAV